MRISDWSSDVCSSDLARRGAGIHETVPGAVSRHRRAGDVIHAGAPQTAVVQDESAWFDDLDRHAEAGAEAEHRADVLGAVGLEQSELHGRLRSGLWRSGHLPRVGVRLSFTVASIGCA